jgi:glycosyltransferase involved in cell wall biosynthesis
MSVIEDFDGVTTVSKVDADFFRRSGCQTPVMDIPFGIDITRYKVQPDLKDFPSLFHLGAMNWIPNLEGIKWFLDHAWPLIHNKFPGLKFYLAGRLMPEWLLNLKMPNVVVLGEVADATGFINSKSVMVVPLFSGSGIRVKIIEAMALGKAVISTAIGAEGIEYTAGENILIANNPDEFIRAVESCIQDIDRTEQIGRNARKLIEDKHSLAMLIRKLEAFYQSLIEN